MKNKSTIGLSLLSIGVVAIIASGVTNLRETQKSEQLNAKVLQAVEKSLTPTATPSAMPSVTPTKMVSPTVNSVRVK